LKGGQVDKRSDCFTVRRSVDLEPTIYTYDPAVSRQKKAVLISPGSPAFQQILKECLEDGVLCEIALKTKDPLEDYLKQLYKDTSHPCQGCSKTSQGGAAIGICPLTEPCFHKINNAKITNVKVIKQQQAKLYKLYFSLTFQNKLKPKSEEIVGILTNEEFETLAVGEEELGFLENEQLDIQDVKPKLTVAVFDSIKAVADQQIEPLIKQKLVFYDLPLVEEKKTKLQCYNRRIRREHLEGLISGKREFDAGRWQANYESLMKREEEALATTVTTKLVSLLVVNTEKIRYKVNLDNGASIEASAVLGLSNAEVTCQVCRKPITEGFATQDTFYVCKDCTLQSIDTGQIYSKKAVVKLDETLNEFIGQNEGFVCTVCGKKHSRLLEFKCSWDDSSVCIYHYELCDVCGKAFSKHNLKFTDQFQRQLCPDHAYTYKEH
jgi:hypothetical protein